MNPQVRIETKEIVMVPLTELQLDPQNRNIHPKEQIDRLADIIKHHGMRWPIIVSKRSGFVKAGEGRYLAAEKLKMIKVPVMYQDFDSEDEETTFGISDNAIAKWAELDFKAINEFDLPNLGPDLDLDLLGFKDFTLDPSSSEKKEDPYTAKIECPIYSPKGQRPSISDLFDSSKTEKFIEKIRSSVLSVEEKDFLTVAACRHTVFDYENIAEYYSHASKEVQALMEESALVIIDFQKAIENGFVQLSESIASDYSASE